MKRSGIARRRHRGVSVRGTGLGSALGGVRGPVPGRRTGRWRWIARGLIGLSILGPSAISSCSEDVPPAVSDPPAPPITTTGSTGAMSTGPSTTTGEVLCYVPPSPGTGPGPVDPTASGTSVSLECTAACCCAADYAIGDPTPPPAEDFVCREFCIPVGAIGLWCSGDESCCEGSCKLDGLCGYAPMPTSDGGSSSSGTSGSGSSGSGSSGSGSSSSDSTSSGTSGSGSDSSGSSGTSGSGSSGSGSSSTGT